MCGIAGRVNFRSGAPVDRAVVTRMGDLISYRGPDGSGVEVRGALGFAHRRLAIIDLSPGGRQPMSDGHGLTITFNGEIYNFLELRRELQQRGHTFRSESDTEVILASYREFGTDCVLKLRGMFAFAIWDENDHTLFIARDRLGKKPLHYLLDRDGIAFASEPKAFLADPSFVPGVNLDAISYYLSYQYVPSPLSAFAGVAKLPPAHYLLVQNGQVSIKRYWTLSYEPKQPLSEADACAELLARLEDAVRLRLISDVPLGAFLSGGVDSSVIVALMAQLTPDPVKTFSIGFAEQDYNELPYARMVAKRYGTDHHEFIVRPDAVEIFDKLVWHYNEPYADESAIPTYYLSKMTRQHVTVALNGDGGDENFAGYTRYALAGEWRQRPLALRRAANLAGHLFATGSRPSRLALRGKRWLERFGAPLAERYAWRMMHFEPFIKRRVCSGAFLEATGGDDTSKLLVDAFQRAPASNPLDSMMATDVAYYLPDCLLVKVDIATMAHGLEGRSPLLDHEFMEFAARLPAETKRQNGAGKHLFRKAVAHLLPPEVLERRKMGFGVPLDRWFRNELRDLAYDTLLSRRMTERGYFRTGEVQRMLDEHTRGVAEWHDQLWNLLMLERWHQVFVDTPRPASSASPSDTLATLSS